MTGLCSQCQTRIVFWGKCTGESRGKTVEKIGKITLKPFLQRESLEKQHYGTYVNHREAY